MERLIDKIEIFDGYLDKIPPLLRESECVKKLDSFVHGENKIAERFIKLEESSDEVWEIIEYYQLENAINEALDYLMDFLKSIGILPKILVVRTTTRPLIIQVHCSQN
jgi:hypothetical protein